MLALTSSGLGDFFDIVTFSIYQISEYHFSRVLIGSRNSEYPWLVTAVLRSKPRLRLASRHFLCLLVGRKIIFMLNLQQNRKNAHDKILKKVSNRIKFLLLTLIIYKKLLISFLSN